MRAKWDRADYRNTTITKALEGKTEFFSASVKDDTGAAEASTTDTNDD